MSGPPGAVKGQFRWGVIHGFGRYTYAKQITDEYDHTHKVGSIHEGLHVFDLNHGPARYTRPDGTVECQLCKVNITSSPPRAPHSAHMAPTDVPA